MGLPGNKIPAERAAQLREAYRAALFDDVVPWWMEHSLDHEYGGYFSLLERDEVPEPKVFCSRRQVW